ncbi:MAG: esterase/lipase family protein [Pseudomonadota bacterium]
MNILLLHGIFDTARIFKPMQTMLEASGHVCLAPSMKPSDARHGIHDLACFVERYVNRYLPESEPFAVVGFSMGGIVARQYMQALGGAARVPAFFSISSPHAGTLASYLHFGQGAMDMRPDSALLSALRRTEDRLDGMAIHNYWTPLDMVVVPATNCRWPRADSETRVHAWLHATMPRHPVVCRDITRRIHALESSMLPHSGET